MYVMFVFWLVVCYLYCAFCPVSSIFVLIYGDYYKILEIILFDNADGTTIEPVSLPAKGLSSAF